MTTLEKDEVLMEVERLIPGMQVDLYRDPIADPGGDEVSYEYEYQVVDQVDEETPECTAVAFDNAWVGFPHGYKVRVRIEGSMP